MADSFPNFDELSQQELNELNTPDDNPDEADIDASARHMRIATVLCAAGAGLVAFAAIRGICRHLRNRREERELTRDLSRVRDDLQRIAANVSPTQFIADHEIRKAANRVSERVSERVHDLPGEVQDAAARVREAINNRERA